MSKDPPKKGDKGNSSQDEDEDDETLFSYINWQADLHLTEDGAKKVEKASLQEEGTIMCVSESDIIAMKLQLGDQIRLRNGIRQMKEKYANPPPLDDTTASMPARTPPTSGTSPAVDSQYSLSEVMAILNKGSSQGPTTVTPQVGTTSSQQPRSLPCLGNRPAAVPNQRDITTSYLHDLLVLGDCNAQATAENRGEKALLPVNFTSNLRGTTPDNEETISQGFGTRLVLKSAVRRVTPDRLTQGQYFAANARIMAKLVAKFTSEEMYEYLDFQRQIGDLLQVFTCGSVIILDNEHRLEVAETGRRWNQINPTTQIALLRHREEAANRANANRGGAAHASGNSTRGPAGQGNPPRAPSNKICTAYNTEAGCKYGTGCIFRHVCSVMDCLKNHPAFWHNASGFETPPRWLG
jgi:hypothetical protein